MTFEGYKEKKIPLELSSWNIFLGNQQAITI